MKIINHAIQNNYLSNFNRDSYRTSYSDIII